MNSLIELVCPSCKSQLSSGVLGFTCLTCKQGFAIVSKIPRFVPASNYSNSFGLQWNRFAKTQLDSTQSTNRSRDRFLNETLWDAQEVVGKLVLDAGCGSGRFSEIALNLGAKLVAVDYSSAVDAASENLKSKDLLILQADLEALPLKDQTFDFIYCIGVLQHTSRPKKIVQELLRCLKDGGEVTLTFYEDSSWHVKLYSKYLIRPITKRIPNSTLLQIIDKSSFIWFPVTKYLFNLPQPLSRIFRFLLPIANYVEFHYLKKESAREEAILDTFDMLSPAYDKPIKKSEVLKWVAESNVKTVRLDSQVSLGTMKFKRIS